MGRLWSKRGENLLKQLWENEKISYEDILRVFLDRTEKAIECKAMELGLKPRSQRVKERIDEEWLKKLLEVTEG